MSSNNNDMGNVAVDASTATDDAAKIDSSSRKAPRNIGIKTSAPDADCDDRNCPFHGSLSVRGKLFDGRITGAKARQTATLQKYVPVYFEKFKRYARDKSTIHAHVPGCITVQNGDSVLAAECRPISKSVSYVIVEVRQ